MSIVEARAAREALRAEADPIQAERDAKAIAAQGEKPFREIAERWLEARANTNDWTDVYKVAIERRLETYVYRKLGARPIASISMEDVFSLITGIKKAPKTAIYVKQHIIGIFDFAVRWRHVQFNPARQVAIDLPSRKRRKEAPRTYVKTIEQARAVLRAIETNARLTPWTLLAHRLIALTAVRKNEALGARWREFDLDAAVWIVPEERMKGKAGYRRAHTVALAPQAIEVLRAAKKLAALLGREGEFVFPTQSVKRFGQTTEKRPFMSAATLTNALRKSLAIAGLDRAIVTHGWRGTFSTIMNEEDPASFRILDAMLAHSAFRDSADTQDARSSSVEGRYNHAEFRSPKHRLWCRWADMLLDGAPRADALIWGGFEAPATNVVPLRRVAA